MTEPTPSLAPADGDADAAAPRPKILLVDDQPINIQALYQVFATDHQVFMATSGEIALAMCRDKLPDIVLLDVEMPGMNGYEVCAQLKADDATSRIPVIFVTSYNDEAAETRGLDAGAMDFISKPFNPQVVRARVKTHITLKRQSDLLQQMVFVDGMTGAYNRRYFDKQLDIEYRRAQRNGSPLSLILIDVDDFKRYNDRYGHQAGDDCLRRVADFLRTRLKRPADFVARYGGEEFACLLPETTGRQALDFAHLLARQVQALGIEHLDSRAGPTVSVSLGVAGCGAGVDNGLALVALADACLYRAKSEGRARACGVPEPPRVG
ncbi:MAG: diguanylate cyclase [Pseudomonadota bacterium]